jgi:hypothetical protein
MDRAGCHHLNVCWYHTPYEGCHSRARYQIDYMDWTTLAVID